TVMKPAPAIAPLGALDERLNNAAGDALEHRAQHAVEHPGGELEFEFETDPGSRLVELLETPGALEHPERALAQAHVDLRTRLVAVDGDEGFLQPLEIDVDPRHRLVPVVLEHLRAPAPGQELAVGVDVLDQ